MNHRPARLWQPRRRRLGAIARGIWRAYAAVGLLAWMLAGCTAAPPGPRVRIAEQFGLAYAPLTLMRIGGYLAAELPEHRIEWSRLGNATAIREAMIADTLDIGFLGIPPFLIGADGGMPWRIFTALSETPMQLVTTNPAIASFADLLPSHRVAVPQPGSIQHILLAMAAQRQFADPARFDNRLVTMAHPDATQALATGGQVDAYLAPPPYLNQLLQYPQTRSLLSGTEAFGGRFTFIVGITTDAFVRADESVLPAFRRALDRAQRAIAAREPILAQLAAELQIDTQFLIDQLSAAGVCYGCPVTGVEQFAQFMFDQGYLTRVPAAAELMITDAAPSAP